MEVVRAGLPVVPEALGAGDLPSSDSAIPFEPLDRDPSEGVRHGYVQSTSGRFGFKVIDLSLPSRIPLRVGRVYDGGLQGALPGVPVGQESRVTMDMGANWLLFPTSMVAHYLPGFMMLTDEAGLVHYVQDPVSGDYLPAPDRPSRFGRLKQLPAGAGFEVQMSNGFTRTYTVLPQGNYWLTKEEDPAGNYLTYAYRDGFLEKVTSSDGHWIQIYRPLWGEPAPATTPDERIVRIADSLSRELLFGYDSNGNMTSFTDLAGGVWTYSVDLDDHLVDVLDPAGRQIFHVVTDNSDRTTSMRLGDFTTSFSYQSSYTDITAPGNQIWRYQFDTRGMTTNVIDPESGTWTLVRDATTGDLTKLIEPTGDNLTNNHLFEYDSEHRLTKYESPDIGPPQQSPASRLAWTYSYNANGALYRTVSPTGAASELLYDAAGSLTGEARDPDSNGVADAITTYERDVTTGDITAVVDPNGRRTEYSYDSYGQIVSVAPKPCLVAGVCPELKFEYDTAGRTTKIRVPTGFDQGLQQPIYSDWTTTWNAVGAPTQFTDPLGSTWTLVSDSLGKVTSMTQPNTGVQTFAYLLDGRLKSFQDALGNLHQWQYGADGNVEWYESPSLDKWVYTWDGVGRLLTSTDPEARVWSHAYDASGRLLTKTLPGGQQIQHLYDPAGRLIQRDLPGGGTETFEWTPDGNLAQMEQSTSLGGDDTWTYAWNGLALPTSITQSLDRDGVSQLVKTSTYTWDSSGLLSSWVDTDGKTHSITRDGWGRVSDIALTPGVIVSEIDYEDWSGWISRRYHGESAVEELYGYDAAGRVTSLVEKTLGATTTDTAFSYTHGLLNQLTDNLASPVETTTQSYDLAGRLTGIVRPDQFSDELIWDENGRFVQVDYSQDGFPGFQRVTYDRSGRVELLETHRDTTSFVWDFTPLEAFAGASIERQNVGESGIYRHKLLLDADLRIRSVQEAEEDESALFFRQEYRWAPAGLARAVALKERSSGQQVDSDRLFAQDLSAPFATYDASLPSGDSLWTVSQISQSGVSPAAWLSQVPGHRFQVRDTGALVARILAGGTNGVMQAFGGATTIGGPSLPSFDSISRTLGARSRVSSDDESLLALPDTLPIDPNFGFPAVASRSPSASIPRADGIDPGDTTLCDLGARAGQSGMSAGCIDGAGISVGLKERGSTPGDRFWFEDLPEHLPDPEEGAAGAAGRPGLQMPPLRNPASHPLGVTLMKSSGEYTLGVTDIAIPGVDQAMMLSRSYRNQGKFQGYLGLNWTMPYVDEKVTIGVGELTWHTPGGLDRMWSVDGPGDVHGGNLIKVRWDGGSTAEIRSIDGTIRTFEFKPSSFPHKYYLSRITRPGGSTIRLTWQEDDYGAPWPTYDPQKIELLACDDRTESNPIGAQACRELSNGPGTTLAPGDPGYFDPPVLGTFEFELEGSTIYKRIKHIDTTIHRASGNDHTRRVLYFYEQPMRENADPGQPDEPVGPSYARQLVRVAVADCQGACGNPGPSDGETVARYEWVKPEKAPFVYGYRGDYNNIERVFDSEDRLVLELEYDGVDSVKRVAAGTGGFAADERVVEFHWFDPNCPSVYSGACWTDDPPPGTAGQWLPTVLSDGRETKYDFNDNGNMKFVRHPDGTEIHYEYDDKGRLTKTTWPSGRIQEWIYPGDSYGVVWEQASEFRERASPGSGLPDKLYCYELEPLTNTVWRTLVPPAGGTCDFSDPNYAARITTTEYGWMKAGVGNAGNQTFDNDLEAYLDYWDLVPYGPDPPLPFNGAGDAAWPWFSPVTELSRGAETYVDSNGLKQTASTPIRQVTDHRFNDFGQVKWTDEIERSASGDQHLRRTCFDYLNSTVQGPDLGGPNLPGRLARSRVYGPDSSGGPVNCASTATPVSETRFVYDEWGNASQTHRWLDSPASGDRWLISEDERDFRGRNLRSVIKSSDPGHSNFVETLREYYPGGSRLRYEKFDTSSSADATARTYSAKEYLYGTSGLVEDEKGWTSSPASGAPSGASDTERRVEFDDFGNVTQEAVRLEAGSWALTTTQYDSMNRVEKVTSYHQPQPGPAVTTTNPTYTIESIWYDGFGRPEWTQESGRHYESGIAKDTIGAIVEIVYDDHDRISEERLCSNGDSPGDVDSNTKPACSQILRRSDYSYDEENRVTSTRVFALPDSTSTTLELMTWSESVYDTRGRVIIERVAEWEGTPPAGGCTGTCSWIETTFGLDALGRIVYAGAPAPTSGMNVVTTTYDAQGRPLVVEDSKQDTVTLTRNGLGLVTERVSTEASGAYDTITITEGFEYDVLGRPVKMLLKPAPAGNPSGFEREIVRKLDARGLVVASWSPLGSAAQGDAYKTESQYDGLGRKILSRKHISSSDAYSDDWQDIEYQYDDAGRLTHTIVEPNGADGITAQTTVYQYDAQGRRTLRKLPDHREHRVSYDSLGRPYTTTYAAGIGTCAAGSNDCVQLTSAWDVSGRRMSLTIDTSEASASHYSGTTLQKWEYDGLDRVILATDNNGQGHFDYDHDGTLDDLDSDGTPDDFDNVITTYVYDSLGRITIEGLGNDTNAPQRWKLESSYDRSGFRTSLIYPKVASIDGDVISYTPDSFGRLVNIQRDGASVVDYEFAGSRVVKATHGNGIEWTAFTGTAPSFDEAGRRLLGRVASTQGGAVWFEEQMQYDANNRVTAVVWAHGRTGQDSEAQTFDYDELGRLDAFEQGKWDSGTNRVGGPPTDSNDWALDELGNWREQDSLLGPKLSNAVDDVNAYTTWQEHDGASVQTLNFTYDPARAFLFERPRANGEDARYIHDGLGRLVHVQKKISGSFKTVASYGYSADGRVAWRSDDTAQTWFIRDGSNTVTELTAGAVPSADSKVWDNTWSGSQLVATTDTTGGVTHSVHVDRLGSVVLTMSDSSGSLLQTGQAVYDPYGNASSVPAWGPSSLPVSFGYAGSWTDEASGLLLMGARWYDSGLGRFIQQDPIGEEGGPNLYAYVGASPTMWVDPTGLSAESAQDFDGKSAIRRLLGVPDYRVNSPKAFVATQSKPWKTGSSSETKSTKRSTKSSAKAQGAGTEGATTNNADAVSHSSQTAGAEAVVGGQAVAGDAVGSLERPPGDSKVTLVGHKDEAWNLKDGVADMISGLEEKAGVELEVTEDDRLEIVGMLDGDYSLEARNILVETLYGDHGSVTMTFVEGDDTVHIGEANTRRATFDLEDIAMMAPELGLDERTLDGSMVFLHESCHVLGLSDHLFRAGDIQGDVVRRMNIVRRELNLPQRDEYSGWRTRKGFRLTPNGGSIEYFRSYQSMGEGRYRYHTPHKW